MLSKIDEYFLTITEAGSLSKAAQILYVSQPSLTKQIKYLEAKLGTPLFDHSTKPLRLNAAGEIYRKYLLDSIQKEEKLLLELQEANDKKRGVLTVGTPPYQGRFLLPKILPEFLKIIPTCPLRSPKRMEHRYKLP